MQINISGHHLELTDAITTYVNTKFAKLERHFDQITNVQVILTTDKKTGPNAEAELHLAGAQVFASQKHDDMYAAIDGLVDKLDRQVIKHKEKLQKH